MTNIELLEKNFGMVAEWIKETFPNAIKCSYDKRIECSSKHHVYHTNYIIIKNGVIYLARGSHGWQSNDELYSSEDGKCYDYYLTKEINRARKEHILEEFLHEWGEQKLYIKCSLQPYESMVNFVV